MTFPVFPQLQAATVLSVPWSRPCLVTAPAVACRNKTEPEGRCEQNEMPLGLLSHLLHMGRAMGTAGNLSSCGKEVGAERMVKA